MGFSRTPLTTVDPLLEIAQDNIQAISATNIFGQTTNADNAVPTDVWNRAAQPIWVAPTTARIHNIVSDDVADDGAPLGVGLQIVTVKGLTAWTSVEVSEDIIMNGTTDVPTVNAYVIINSIVAKEWGSAGPNVGIITATAVIDLSVTAQIEPDAGRSLMAIFGFSSLETVLVGEMFTSLVKGQAGTDTSVKLLVNQHCDTQLAGFVTEHTCGLRQVGSSRGTKNFKFFKKFLGPAIIKVQVLTDFSNVEISADFDIVKILN